ncbi:shematrin-like protein 2 isoform X4 [Anopheles aquasalis]|uniref:shematrin-like protein 2 isoform X4 n=1 Tax=Anopheles aquasalis TaxID=42839 RepID=UPI00215AB643|nr:shematrin-like protein 2 isoform X4 [Anopheles aquasalis]
MHGPKGNLIVMKFLILCAFVAGASAAYSSSQYGDGKATGLYNTVSTADGAYADKFPHGGTGYNGGFTTHYVSPNGGGVAVGAGTANFAPGFGGGFAPGYGAPGFGGPGFNPAFGAPTVDFNNFFQGIQSNFANAMTQSRAGPGAAVSARASLLGSPRQRPRTQDQINLYQQQFAAQQALFNNIRQQQAALATLNAGVPVYASNFASGGNYGNGGGFNGASSSASYGPGGFHQTASIYPNNPAVPNVDTRFGGSDQSTTIQSGRPGYVGVSSFSSSSNINGQTHREAITSVNDNGKITTHRVHS